MASKPIRVPGPDHPITVEPAPGRVRVRVAGRVIADSAAVLSLREANYPAVFYVPRIDIDMTALGRSESASYCPYKGDASYFRAIGPDASDLAWSYETPHPAMTAITGHLAFYSDRVDAIEHENPAA